MSTRPFSSRPRRDPISPSAPGSTLGRRPGFDPAPWLLIPRRRGAERQPPVTPRGDLGTNPMRRQGADGV